MVELCPQPSPAYGVSLVVCKENQFGPTVLRTKRHIEEEEEEEVDSVEGEELLDDGIEVEDDDEDQWR